MTNELAKLETDYSTPVSSKLAGRRLQDAALALTEDDWRDIERFAAEPPPPQRPATADDVKKNIGVLAGSLAMRKTGIDEGRLRLSLYVRLLEGKSLFALQQACLKIASTERWMPEPAVIIDAMKEFEQPDIRDHRLAKSMIENRKADEFVRQSQRIRRGEVPDNELADLDDDLIEYGIRHRWIVRLRDGSVLYRNRESMDRWMAENRAQIEASDQSHESEI